MRGNAKSNIGKKLNDIDLQFDGNSFDLFLSEYRKTTPSMGLMHLIPEVKYLYTMILTQGFTD